PSQWPDAERKEAAYVALWTPALLGPRVECRLDGLHIGLRCRRLLDDAFTDQRLNDIRAENECIPAIESEKVHRTRSAKMRGVFLEMLHEPDLIGRGPALQECTERAVRLCNLYHKPGIFDRGLDFRAVA